MYHESTSALCLAASEVGHNARFGHGARARVWYATVFGGGNAGNPMKSRRRGDDREWEETGGGWS